MSSSDPSAIAVPASLVVPAGSHVATFTFTNSYGGTPKGVTLEASYIGAISEASIEVPGPHACQPHHCPAGTWLDPDTCVCERGTPN